MGLRQVLPFVGAAVGGYFGGPSGAQAGWGLGSIAGQIIDPKILAGPRLGEIAQQTSQEGVPRPIVFGTSPPITGNIIATSAPKIHKTKERQGKGGPVIETETVTRTYAIRVCEGPIVGFLRIWRNGKIVYDVTEQSLLSALDNSAFMANARFYLGTYSQNPSPDLEAFLGVGNTCAHRGTAYMVMADEDLTDSAGAIPQWGFQVVATGLPTQPFSRVVTGNRPLSDQPLVDSEQTSGLRNVAVFVVVGRRMNEAELPVPQFRDIPGGSYFDMSEVEDAYSIAANTGGSASNHYELRVYYVHIARPRHNYGGYGADIIGQLNFPGGSGGAYSIAVYRNIDPGVIYGDIWGYVVHDATTDPGEIHLGPDDVPSLTVAAWTFDFDDEFFPNLGVAYEPGGFVDPGQPNVYNTNANSDGKKGYRFGILNVGGTDGYQDYIRRPNFFLRSPIDYAGDFRHSLTLRRIPLFQLPDVLIAQAPQVTDVIEAMCLRANMPADRFDTSMLPDDTVDGIVVTNQYPTAESLRAIGRVFLFDDSSYDGRINFVPRGGDSVATVTEEEMVDDESTIQQVKRSDSITIPRVLNLNYYDIDNGGLATAKQTSTRGGDRRAFGDMSIETPVVMTAGRAAKTVDIQHKVMIEESKGELKFSLPDKFIRLVTTNPLIVQWEGRSERAMIVKADTQDGLQEYVLRRDRQSAYTSDVEGIPPPRPTAPPSSIPGATLVELLDIHILRDADDNAGLGYYVAVAGLTEAWAGALVELSYDGGANYVDSATSTGRAIIGELRTELPAHPQEFPDTLNTVTVRLKTFDAELQDTDLVGMLNRANLAIIGDEIVNFAEVNDLGDGDWEISYFLRGRKGTAAVSHPVGTRFLLLDRTQLAFVAASVTDIGRTMTFRATSYGTSSDTGTVATMTFAGRVQIERQPAYLEASRDGSDMVVTWQGVGRLGGGAKVAQGTRFAGYRVRLSDGTNPSIVLDTSAQTLTQNVSTLTAGPITVRVFQLNSLTGEGPAAEVIVA